MKLLELAELLKNRVVKLFPNKIAIIGLYGSTAQGKDNKFSDLDMFAILDNKEESNLPWEFIFQDHTVDFWKMDWQEAERLASGKKMSSPWAVSASLFMNSRVLYSRSESDKNQFNLLVEKTKRFEGENLKQILKEFNSGYTHIEIIKFAKENNDLLSARWATWQLINRSVQNLSLINNSFLTKNWGANLQEVFSFEILPNNYSKLVTTLCTENNFDEMIILGRKLLESIRKLVLEKQQNFFIDKPEKKNLLCNKYISMKAYINKIMSACHKRDILAVSYAATELQIWIAEEIAKCEGNLLVNVDNFNLFEEIKIFYTQLNFPDLMNGISKINFQEIEKAAKELDLKLLEYCRNQKFKIPKFQHLEEVNNYFQR